MVTTWNSVRFFLNRVFTRVSEIYFSTYANSTLVQTNLEQIVKIKILWEILQKSGKESPPINNYEIYSKNAK